MGVAAREQSDAQPTDADLARAARAGDARAFRTLYDAHADFVFRTCCRLGLGEADAEDATQEAFLIASRKLEDFHQGRFSTWIFRIAANVVSARHRKRRVREALFALWGRPEERTAPGPDTAVERGEAQELVRAALARMAPKKREVFALFEIEGLSGAEIAERVGCPVDTVWTRLFHARREFERIVRKSGLTDPERR